MYLGIDLGTSELKILLLDRNHQVVGSAASPLTLTRPQANWSEQAPADWWLATEMAIADVRAAWPEQFAQVRAIGLSGQMHGAVLLDWQDQVLRPAILWNDSRSTVECVELTAAVPQLHSLAGNLAMPGFTAPKLLWVKKHERTLFAQVDSVLLPKDYLRFRLTGEKVSEPSDAAGTLWLDVARRDWSDTLLGACGLTRAHMPRLVDSNASSGHLLPALAARWGLSEAVIVAGGAGDNAASAIGMGAIDAGDGFVSLGTSGVLFVADDHYRPNPAQAVHAFCHALPQRWHQMSVMLSAASCLSWMTGLTGSLDEAAMLAEIDAMPTGGLRSAPLFLPYLSGERTPHNDPFAQGVLFGLGHASSRAQCAYAVLEGVAFGMADGLAALRAGGTTVAALSLVGGGARSSYWAQLIADVLDLPIHTHADSAAGAALGAARLAMMADGASVEEACGKPAVLARYTPHAARHLILQERLQRFRELYRHLRPVFAHHGSGAQSKAGEKK